ncbi:MAG: hypothetical protein AAGE76_01800 [Pseudomonadota bacterium]
MLEDRRPEAARNDHANTLRDTPAPVEQRRYHSDDPKPVDEGLRVLYG